MSKHLPTNMRLVTLMIALFLGTGMAYASYDCTAVCPTGQTLYFKIIKTTNHYVQLTYPGNSVSDPWDGYVEPTGNITLPSSIHCFGNDYTLTEIGQYAFRDCEGLTGSLIIPNSVTVIRDHAFYGCSGLTGLTLGSSVTTIGYSAFYGCTGFTGTLTIPNSVTSIGINAFADCWNFTELTIGNSVTEIGGSAFLRCSGFTGSLTIPNSVTYLDALAFEDCSGFTGSLTIPNSVTYIGMFAFYGCSGFTGSLTIGTAVTEIGEGAFYDCSGFTQVKYNAINCVDLESDEVVLSPFEGCGGALSFGSQVQRIPAYMFYNCSGFTGSLTIGNPVTEIGQYAFYGCSGFTGSLTLGNSVTTLSNNAFDGCSGFTGSLTVGTAVTSIGNYVFKNCNGFSQVNFNAVSCEDFDYHTFYNEHSPFEDCGGVLSIGSQVQRIPGYMFYNCSGFTGSLTIPNSVTTIGTSAFSRCSGFTGSLTIGNSVTEIGESAFLRCSGFTGSLTIPNSVISIRSAAFDQCSGFTGSLTIPNSVTTIGYDAFYDCTGFTGSLTIGNSVTTIGDWAFRDCSGFTGSLTIGNSVTAIGERAFYNCSGFTGSLTIPNAVTSIDFGAFYRCNGFTGLTIGSGVTSIGQWAFYDCTGLAFMTVLPETPPTLGTGAFNNVSTTIPVHVPCGSLEDYQAASGWSDFTNIYGCDPLIYSINDDGVSVTVVGHEDGASATGQLTIPSTTTINGVTYTVTAIGYMAFYYCKYLTGLTIPNTVTTIGEQAFSYCYSMTGTLDIPDSVTTIGRAAFYYCYGFTGLTLGNSVTTIEEYAFLYCTGLTGSLILPNSVTALGNSVFGYTDFTSITAYPETPPTSSTYTFQNIPTDIPVCVPCGSLDDYMTAAGWSAFSNWECMCVTKSLPYTFGFENSDEMECWTRQDCNSQSGIYSAAAHEGSKGFRFYYNTNPPQYLISPEFEGTSAMYVSFYYRNALDSYPETFQVGYSTTTRSPNAFTWGAEVTANDQNTWMLYEDYFPEGTKYVAVKLTSYDQFYLYLDDFSFSDTPPTPSNLTVDNITSNSADVHWTGSTDDYNVRYRETSSGSWINMVAHLNSPGDSFEDGFEDGLDNWTLIDADGDGRSWDVGQISGGSPHGGNKMAFSFSWYGGSALFPDNYLVTPQVELGGTVTFWASAGDLNDYAEHFGIAVSTGSNTDLDDFTMVQEWTMTAKGGGQGDLRGNRALGTWRQYSIDLSAYAGQTGYIAIRHFDCTDQFALAVDDFSYIKESMSSDGITLEGLDPATTYEVQVQGIYTFGLTEWSESVTFTTDGPATITQAIALQDGWNWWSTNLDITLGDLENAIVDALGSGASGASIKAKNRATTFNGSIWRGTLNSLDVALMYKIYVPSACEITLTGTRLDPSTHPVTIRNGANWIAFPLSESMSLANAFAGFTANGDMVRSKTTASTYNGTWRGTLKNLVPGQGYIYKSAVSGDRTFTFPMGKN